LVFGVGQLVLHVENGLLEIFLAVCGSLVPAPSCWNERRRQTSCAAAAVLLAEWRARGSCITACLHFTPPSSQPPPPSPPMWICGKMLAFATIAIAA